MKQPCASTRAMAASMRPAKRLRWAARSISASFDGGSGIVLF
jgi:hypothetical protein